MAVKCAVIYYSATGTTYLMAKAIEEGAQAAGAETRLRRVHELAPPAAIASNPGWAAHAKETESLAEATLDDLTWADAIVFGTPTRYGLPTAQLKQFLDMTGGLWAKGKLVDKVVSSFCSTSTQHGGQETTLTALNNTFYHWGAIIAAPGYIEPIQFETGNPYGASFVSDNGKRKPDEPHLQSCRFQGRRVVDVAARLLAGRAPSAG